MMWHAFVLLLLIFTFVVGSENSNDKSISALHADIQPNTNLTCFCTGDETCDANAHSCRITHEDHACYESWTKDPYDHTVHLTAGCIYNDFFITQILCNNNQSDRYIICCTDKDLCNDRDAFAGDIRRHFAALSNPGKRKPKKSPVVLIVCIAFGLILSILSVTAFILLHWKRKIMKSAVDEEKADASVFKARLMNYIRPRSKLATPIVQIDDGLDEISEGSDRCGYPLLSPIHFAKQITLDKKVGVGGYGCVYRGKWHDEVIAVKIFSATDEPSWVREVYIYETLGLNHENILRYIAADNIDVCNSIERWIATEYHENGSVYDYLTTHTVTVPTMLKMMFTIASGLCHLHRPIDAARGKVALAHRDLKTKNILVKGDLTCCIADLGLAVKEKRQLRNTDEKPTVIDIIANHRAGTIRYMSPEILNKTLNDQNFDSYKAADLYALGLVFWEILRRCRTSPEGNDAEAYQLPYEDVLPNNPSFEQMQEVVCERGLRPPASPRWQSNSTCTSMFELCQELWLENPSCRPSSYRVQKQLREHSQWLETESVSTADDSRIEGPQTI